MRKSGNYKKIGSVEHFVPYKLPPHDPVFNLDIEIVNLLSQAMIELGKFNGIISGLPDKKRFLKAYVIKEALLSSSIEGINTTLLEVYTQPLLESRPNKNTQLVINYKDALEKAVYMIKDEGLPISSRVILAAHKELMELSEGDKSNPGNYRKQAVRVGNLVPAPAQDINSLMGHLEEFINIDESLPVLIKIGLVHVQFETIHPFLDGNGRIGRLLIVLMLVENKILSDPILYPSYYFKKNHAEYYQKLDLVRKTGDFESWIKFFLIGIRDSSIDAYNRAKSIKELHESLLDVLNNTKNSGLMLKALDIIFNNPVINIKELSLQLDISYNSASKIILGFLEFDILKLDSQRKRGKLYKFWKYLDILALPSEI